MKEYMKFLTNKIETKRELSDLDLFTLDFVKILEKHTTYVIVSGYVSIILGRARISEDIDIIIPKISFEKFKILLKDLEKKFYCLNTEGSKNIFGYISNKTAIRFAKKDKVIPNIELKFAKNISDELALKNKITIKTKKGDLLISQLELQIAFKEAVLKSPKDLEDARHLRNVAEEHLDNALIKKYKMMLDEI